MKRVFLIVLDSFGIGEMPDADRFGDAGSNTLGTCRKSEKLHVPNMASLGLFKIDGVEPEGSGLKEPDDGRNIAQAAMSDGRDVVLTTSDGTALKHAFARLAERSDGKDTTTGHWEIAGLVSEKPMPTFPDGFPEDFMERYSAAVGRNLLCNKPYSGTQVIEDYGKEHLETGALIVYTSADSVFQIAAHEEIVPVPELYRYCEIAREMLQGELGVGRVIARPFIGTPGNFTRTSNRHDYSLQPPAVTMLDQIKDAGKDVLAVGKINDIFAGKGITEFVRTKDNADGIERTIEWMDRDFEGICFVNLVDFDMLYGHRNDVDGYATALTYFDAQLPRILEKLGQEDLLLITADHGCDPGTPSTDHSREYIPLLIAGANLPVENGTNFGTRETFADIGQTVLSWLAIEPEISGEPLF
ncbi:MAG: phosphopentomutase [Eubacterium sp.]|nr:phosphopentomutase [Eubacterium sp.]